MRAVYYLGTVFFGAFGTLGVLRFFEMILVRRLGEKIMPQTLLFGVVFLGLAWGSLKKARALGNPKPEAPAEPKDGEVESPPEPKDGWS